MAVPAPTERPETPTDRTESFSDGVFAVAITLLVLDLGVGTVRRGGLASALGHEWPHYVTFVVSFLTIGIIWINHHAMFERIARVDRTLVYLNLLLLMTVTAIPFPTRLLASYLHEGPDEEVAAAVYAGSFLLLSVAFAAVNTWSVRAGLVNEWFPIEQLRRQVRRGYVGLGVYASAIGLAFASPIVSLLLCAAIAVYYSLPARV
jgi:TMEM175 potassium channel family protein